MKLGGTKEMRDLKRVGVTRKELRKGQRGARKEQRGQDREERKDIRAERRAERKSNRARKKAVRNIKKAFKGKGAKLAMGAGGAKKHQMGGFLEMPTFDLDRDSI